MIVTLIPIEEDLKNRTEHVIGEPIVLCESIKKGQDLLSQAEILMGWGRITTETIEICKKLQWLHILGAGVEKLPFEMLRARGIAVTNAKGVHGSQMAEHTLGMMIQFSRKFLDFRRAQDRREWKDASRMQIGELTGKTLCIVGAGSIGSEIARKAKAFDMKVIGIKTNPVELDHFDKVTGRQDLLEILEESDYVVMVTPLTPQTTKMIGEKEFAAMKRNGIFINISRGDTVDEAALITALQNKTIAGAGLDVFHDEPLHVESPLWMMENVILTPHMAGLSPNYMERAMQNFSNDLLKHRSGEKMDHAVDLVRGY